MGKIRKKSLSSKEKIFRNINIAGISDRYYKHAQRVRNAFKLNEINKYVPLYYMKYALTSLAVDIDLMKNMSSKFGLNPVNFLTLASFSWECTLKINKIELELLTDVDMILA